MYTVSTVAKDLGFILPQNESFPAGTVGTRKAGTILLEKFSANNETPLPRVVIRWGLTDSKGNPLEDEERSWPGWLNIDELNGMT